MKILNLQNAANKTVILRADLNVPMNGVSITDNSRIKALLPTLKLLQKANCKIVILSHLGRPKNKEAQFSLQPIHAELKKLMDDDVLFSDAKIGSNALSKLVTSLEPKQILLLENIRFYPEEELGDVKFAKDLAQLADIYVNDAFSCCHRAHASISTICQFLPSYAGLLLNTEIVNLQKIIDHNLKPSVAIIGGSKVSTKLKALCKLAKQVDFLIIGGAMANTFLAAQNYNIGKSLHEKELIPQAKELLNSAQCQIILPIDAITQNGIKEIAHLQDDDAIYDIGPKSCAKIEEAISQCKLALWNGPVGMFENENYALGTNFIAKTIAHYTQHANLISIAGGGDTISALEKSLMVDKMSYASLAGGAFLEWLEGAKLPGLEALGC